MEVGLRNLAKYTLHSNSESAAATASILVSNCGNWNGVRVKVWLLLLVFPHTVDFTVRGTTTAEPNIFLWICTHTQTITISSDLCSPMPTHSMTCAHPCPPMLFKLPMCIQKLCNVYYPPTPSLGWIGQIKGRSLSLASARSASWLVYSLHPRSLTPIWR
jgi:hypothetical protein